MGHVDHGKSTLVDYIRKSNIVAGEAGGITQHIGAYQIEHETAEGTRPITFIDTPGHAAFSTMRFRSASVADIAILVVSAEEGVKTQTLEALEAITRARIPYVVAINKIDRPDADPGRTKQSLAEHQIFVEGWGGSVPVVEISAKTGQNVPELLDMILLLADIENFTATIDGTPEGVIIESDRDQKKGVFGTAIIKSGTFERGMYIALDGSVTPARTLENERGEALDTVTPGSPVRIGGFSEIPKVGTTFAGFKTKKEAEKFSEEFKEDKTFANKTSQERPEGFVEMPLIIKADTIGTLEAFEKECTKFSLEKIGVKIASRGVGTITEGDIKTALASTKPVVLGYHVDVDRAARDLAEQNGVEIKLFNVIYHASDWLEKELTTRTPLDTTLPSIGKAKILRTFSSTKKRQVIGGEVLEGILQQKKDARIMRQDEEIGIARIVGLQAQKMQTDKVAAGVQFGAEVESSVTIAVGDILEAYDARLDQ